MPRQISYRNNDDLSNLVPIPFWVIHRCLTFGFQHRNILWGLVNTACTKCIQRDNVKGLGCSQVKFGTRAVGSRRRSQKHGLINMTSQNNLAILEFGR